MKHLLLTLASICSMGVQSQHLRANEPIVLHEAASLYGKLSDEPEGLESSKSASELRILKYKAKIYAVPVVLVGVAGFFLGVLLVKSRLREKSKREWQHSTPNSLLLAIVGAGALGLLRPGSAAACINIDNETLDALYLQVDGGGLLATVLRAMKADPLQHPAMKKTRDAKQSDAEWASDEAARKIVKGQFQEAVADLTAIEKDHKLYQVAANLGTAYELLGNPEEALKWINEGIRRNPDSHMKAEWLLAKILEAQIHLKRDPAWLDNHTIARMDLSAPAFQTSQGSKSRSEMLESYRSQIAVRSLFIKPENRIMGKLLAEAAMLTTQIEFASTPGVLDLAKKYGADDASLDKAEAYYEGIYQGKFQEWRRSPASNSSHYVAMLVAIACGILCFFFGMKWAKKRYAI